MTAQPRFWKRFFDRPLSRREVIRAAATLGAASLPLLRGSALAQNAPGVPAPATPAPRSSLPADYVRRLPELPSAVIPAEVTARKGNQKVWPVLRGISIAQVEIPVGSWRATHLHTNTSELAVVLEGTARAGLQTPEREWLEVELGAGDCVYFPAGWPHWVRNTGDSVLRAYFNYGHEQPVTVEVQP
ncbi:cupin domain-containing protein [Deinococcus apachensis]|uniref:cupin domain-containing protein n=1 Tax=Deinococcus apachensis TaxID=309886 RepID=UPI00037E419B|nr:cupin domain-containing protein [Deinococcus apachensis]